MPTIPTLISRLTPAERPALIQALRPDFARRAYHAFPEWAHDAQKPPPPPWRTWVIQAGRGFGKTRAGAEWVLARVRETPGARVALAGATIGEARALMVEGVSGLLALARADEIAGWSRADGVVRFANGAEATLFSGASPERFRGPDLHFAWCDEIAKWARPRDSWDNLQLALRAGAAPQAVVTTTPRGGGFMDALIKEPETVVTRGSTRDNPFTPAGYKQAMTARYAGTRWGAQELEGVLLSDVEGSLWPGWLVERQRVTPIDPPRACLGEGDHLEEMVEGDWNAANPSVTRFASATSPSQARGGFQRIVIGVDPPASASGTCGIVVCGKDAKEQGFVLEDASIAGASPEGWARAVASAYERWQADRVVAEVNMGGDMVASNLRAAALNLPLTQVRATRGKVKRAEPVAHLFENGRAFFAGRFPELEDELAGFTIGGGYVGAHSPDRADAMVWAVTALMLEPEAAPPRIRQL